MGAKVSKPTSSKVRNLSRSSSIVEAFKPNCMRNRKTKKKKKNQKRAFGSEDKMVNEDAKARKLTLEDWLLASPGPGGMHSDCFSGGELYVFKQFSRRVHPSCSSVAEEATADNSFFADFSSASGSSFSRSTSRSGKLKKKVSFRLPQETDIVMFYSPSNDHEPI